MKWLYDEEWDEFTATNDNLRIDPDDSGKAEVISSNVSYDSTMNAWEAHCTILEANRMGDDDYEPDSKHIGMGYASYEAAMNACCLHAGRAPNLNTWNLKTG